MASTKKAGSQALQEVEVQVRAPMALTKKAGSLALQEAEAQALHIWEVRALTALTKKAGRQTMLGTEVHATGQVVHWGKACQLHSSEG